MSALRWIWFCFASRNGPQNWGILRREGKGDMALLGRIAVVAISIVCFIEPAIAQDIAAGEQVARTSCSSCHEIEARPTPSFAVAPPFRAIARTRGMTQTSIAVFLKTPHEIMPNYVLSEQQIRDVAAYIIDLRSKSKSSLTKMKRR